jgi:hypothetical protein
MVTAIFVLMVPFMIKEIVSHVIPTVSCVIIRDVPFVVRLIILFYQTVNVYAKETFNLSMVLVNVLFHSII